ncbi:MAG: right-handed parallel beta-helix repeat-containing protein [Candidatus Schekmanbacteria bacterium]|nr:right-handed parallel beta-helix repeat-containing protein [Candidatus Schekmanbacteria bacterium]
MTLGEGVYQLRATATDGGGAWSAVASAIANAGTHAWTVPAGLNTASFRLRLSASDLLGATATQATGDLIVDSSAPSCTLDASGTYSGATGTRPWPGAVAGGAADGGPSGLAEVDANIRDASGRSFDGSSFVEGTVWLATVLAGARYSLAFAPPSDQSYALRCRARDRSGNEADGSASVAVDSTAPVAAIATAGDYDDDTWPKAVSGTVGDPGSGASGPSRVDLTLRRDADGGYWDGAAWVAAETWLTAALGTGGTWSYAFSPETGAYAVTARAGDLAGNTQGSPATASFQFSAVFPTSSISTGSVYRQETWPGAIEGRAQSPSPVEAIAAVRVSVQRLADGLYWTGAGWEAGETWLAAAGTTSWQLALSGLADGIYRAQSLATDTAGRVERSPADAQFTFDATAPTATLTYPASGGYSAEGGDDLPGGSFRVLATLADATSGVAAAELVLRRARGAPDESSPHALAIAPPELESVDAVESGTDLGLVPGSYYQVDFGVTDGAGNATHVVVGDWFYGGDGMGGSMLVVDATRGRAGAAGTMRDPLLTITEALDRARRGREWGRAPARGQAAPRANAVTVHVGRGTYAAAREQFPLRVASGTRLLGAGADQVRVVGPQTGSVLVVDGAVGVEVAGLTITGSGTAAPGIPAAGIEVCASGSSVLLRNNVLTDNQVGILVNEAYPEILHNTVARNESHGIVLRYPVTPAGSPDALVKNNLITHNGGAGLYLWVPAEVRTAPELSSAMIQYNGWWANLGGDVEGPEGVVGEAGNVAVDPQYDDLEHGSFRLDAGSPAHTVGEDGAEAGAFGGGGGVPDPDGAGEMVPVGGTAVWGGLVGALGLWLASRRGRRAL